MELLVIRHAIAVDRAAFSGGAAEDGERPLSGEGRRKMARAARGLRRLVPRIDWLASSPLARAWQTAEILARSYGIEIERLPELEPAGDADRLWPVLRRARGGGLRCVVGHEPQLSACIAYLLRGRAARPSDSPLVELKKGGACLLEVEAPGRARIRWLVEPRLLRLLAR